MFVEEARWLGARLAELDLGADPRVLNVGSSTERYRTVDAPHNDAEVLAPLRARGSAITHLDIKEDDGVDVVADLRAPDLDLRRQLGPFSVVLATNLLQLFREEEAKQLLGRLALAVGDRGFLAVTTPRRYHRTADPVDFGFRPSPRDLIEVLCAKGEFSPVAADEVRIDERRYYRGRGTPATHMTVAGVWMRLPGWTERLRRSVKWWRWREACVIVQRS